MSQIYLETYLLKLNYSIIGLVLSPVGTRGSRLVELVCHVGSPRKQKHKELNMNRIY